MKTQLDIGSIISRALSVWMENFISFNGLALVIGLPIYLVNLIPVVTGTSEEPLGIAASLGGGLLMFIVQALVTGTVTFAVFQSLKAGRASTKAGIDVAFSRLGPLIGVSIVMGVGIFFGSLLCLVPGLILMCGWYVAIPSTVVEHTGITESLKRSWSLTDGHRMHIFGLVALVGMVMLLIFSIIFCTTAGVVGVGVATTAPSGPAAAQLPTLVAAGIYFLQWFLQMLMITFSAGMVAIVYHDLRVIKDDVMVDDLLSVFE